MGYDRPWHLTAAAFPADGPLRDRARFALRYAILAPSGHNTQPWRFVLHDHTLDLRADRSRALPVVDPDGRALVISCGAALGHLRVALTRFRLAHAIHPLPDPHDADLLARIHLVAEETAPEVPGMADLCDAIPRRRSNRLPYTDRRPDPRDLMACVAAAEAEGARLHVLTDPRDRDAVADLVAAGDMAQFRDKEFRGELAHWVRSHHGPGHDGVSGAAFGMPDLLSVAGAAAIRHVDMGRTVSAKDRRLIADAPAVAVLTTPGDSPADWLAAGQAISRVLLTLTAAGMACAFLNEPIEVPDLRPRLRGLLPAEGVPQLLFRVGFAPDVPPAARRPLAEVLVET